MLTSSVNNIEADNPIATAVAADSTRSGTRLEGRDILCFSHDWTGDPLSKTHLMRLLARDNRVLWVNSIGYRTPNVTSKADLGRAVRKLAAFATPVKEVERNIHVLNPLTLPLFGGTARAINAALLRFQVKRAMSILRMRKPLNWVFNPAASVIAGRLGEEKVIYYCVDEYTAFDGVQAIQLRAMEDALLRRADLVIVSADKLFASRAKVNPNTVLVRHGTDFEHFRKAIDPSTIIPEEVARLPRPRIGFFGLVADWVDVDLMAHVARHFAQGSVIVIGKVTTDVSVLTRMSNVHMLGRKPYSDLPAFAKGFDVAINPFRINELTLNANPLKVREYLAAGLPVVATRIPEVEVLGQCRVADNAESFVRNIEEVLKDPGPRSWRSETIRGESWDAKLEIIVGHLEAHL